MGRCQGDGVVDNIVKHHIAFRQEVELIAKTS